MDTSILIDFSLKIKETDVSTMYFRTSILPWLRKDPRPTFKNLSPTRIGHQES